MAKKHLETLFVSTLLYICASASAQVVMNINSAQRGPLTSPYQWGLFFEEINHAGDGGLYAELVRNRSFEESQYDNGWQAVSSSIYRRTADNTPLLNDAQDVCLDLYTSSTTSEARKRGIRNEGFWGMKFEKGKTYHLSLYAKGNNNNYTGRVYAALLRNDGKTAVSDTIALTGEVYTDKWNKLTAELTAKDTDLSGQLLLLTSNGGHLYIDVVSLFPDTWNNRSNGLRPDLAQLLADTKPTFLRFPGGCFVEGQQSFDDTWQWKRTIGPIEQRHGHMSHNWGYWSSDGLGFDEYLQLAEDMGAAPLFVVNVGLGHGWYIPMADLDTLVQNTLDAIEYANGDGTTTYGAMRIKNGHPAPYNLKFIEIGNENYNYDMGSNNEQSYQYPERYYKFYSAIKEKYPEITTIGNVEAWGTDNPTWRNEYPVEIVDEHYYRSHAWMKQNYKKYDNYPRDVKVYNGEYAANSGGYGTYGNLNSALGEAVYMLGQERNSDVCVMGSFAPIFTHENNPAWAYDMIHFNSGSNFVTPSYHVQKMMAHNLGYQNLLWTESGNSITATTTHQVGLATWNTQASYDDVKVTVDGKTIISDDFSGNNGWTSYGGSWSVTGGVKKQTADGTNNDRGCRDICQTKFDGSTYTLTLRARKDGGAEGFLIIFDFQDEDNYAWWNIGGWSNTQNAIEICRGGSKAQYSKVNYTVPAGNWLDLKVEVEGNVISCYINGQKYHELTLESERALYQSCQISEDGQEMILKVVNSHGQALQLLLNTDFSIGNGTVERLTSANGTDENTMQNPEKVKPTGPVPFSLAKENAIDIPAYSLNIYRFPITGLQAEEKQKTWADYPEYVEEDKDMAAYLYAHMHETGEYTCYALNTGGNNWNDLLASGEVFSTSQYTKTGGMRDAFTYRLKSGNGFMLVGTDMTSRLGWESNHIMDLMLSPDLIHWTKEVFIDLETNENLAAIGKALGRTMTADLMTAAWAPQVIYDPATKTYILYYSVGVKGDKHYIFYQQIDEELNILSEPRVYFSPGYDIIDADIVWNAVDQQYVMLFKCESTNGFDRATASKLVPEKDATGTTVWTVTKEFHVGENNQAIEGMTQWRPIGQLRWRLAYINYSGGYAYRMRYMDEHCMSVDPVGHNINGNLKAQHGCVMKITQAECDMLKAWDQVVTLLPKVKAFHAVKPTDQHKAAIEAAEAALANSTTFAENAAAMQKALELLKACETDTRQIAIEEAVKNGHGDLTCMIENADFSKGDTSWYTINGFTAANGYVAEFWNKNFYMSQTISGLPDGNYEVGVQSFFRYGSRDVAFQAHRDGTEQLNAKFFANNAETPVMSLYDDSAAKRYGTASYNNYPDNVTQANQAFNTYGLYYNKIETTVTNGTLMIGLYKTDWLDSDWCCFDNFTLTYLGPLTSVKAIRDDNGRREDVVYNLKGQRLHDNATQRGIYISNGQKITIK